MLPFIVGFPSAKEHAMWDFADCMDILPGVSSQRK